MSKSIKWLDTNQIKIEPQKRKKKITGTRLGAIMGVNPWTTPFATWCEITHTYEEKFEDTIYTKAGKVIEPKQAQYIKEAFFQPNLISPTDMYGEDYFQKTFGDFFPEDKVFGGMWDYLIMNDKGTKPIIVIECKTTKRAEDWKKDIPEYYALQAALYATLLKVDEVWMCVSFLKDSDYINPEKFECNAKNTKIIPFKVSERYPNMKETLKEAKLWYRDYAEEGISPEFDENNKVDTKILKELRSKSLNPNTDIEELMSQADKLIEELESFEIVMQPIQKKLDNIKEQLKEYSMKHLGKDHDSLELKTSKTVWKLTRTYTTSIDKEKMEKDKILKKYSIEKEQFRFVNNPIKEE